MGLEDALRKKALEDETTARRLQQEQTEALIRAEEIRRHLRQLSLDAVQECKRRGIPQIALVSVAPGLFGRRKLQFQGLVWELDRFAFDDAGGFYFIRRGGIPRSENDPSFNRQLDAIRRRYSVKTVADQNWCSEPTIDGRLVDDHWTEEYGLNQIVIDTSGVTREDRSFRSLEDAVAAAIVEHRH